MTINEMYKCQENIDAFNRIEFVLDQLEKDGEVVWNEGGVLQISSFPDCTLRLFNFWSGKKDSVLIFLKNHLNDMGEKPTAENIHGLLLKFCLYYVKTGGEFLS